MKIAILSDIHSNVYALKAVLKDAKKKGVIKFINLGDTLYGPIKPYETYKLLQKNNFLHLCGNQDRQLFEATKEEIENNPTLKFVLDEINSKTIKWLKSHPATAIFHDIFLCHGSPEDDLTYLLEDIKEETNVLKDEEQIKTLLKDVEEKIILCGHSHIPRMIELSNGKIVINPGSVGLQAYSEQEPKHTMQNFTSHASYAILEKKKNEVKVELIRVPYKKNKAINQAKINGRVDWMYALHSGKIEH